MNQHVTKWAAITLLLTVAGLCAGEECKGLSELQKAKRQTGEEFFKSIYAWATAASVDCSSFSSVVAKVVHDNPTSGKRLEKEKPFDPKEAEANLNTALADPAIQARLNKLKQAVPDENGRLFLEAAIFDEEGYYPARELRILQLREKMK